MNSRLQSLLAVSCVFGCLTDPDIDRQPASHLEQRNDDAGALASESVCEYDSTVGWIMASVRTEPFGAEVEWAECSGEPTGSPVVPPEVFVDGVPRSLASLTEEGVRAGQTVTVAHFVPSGSACLESTFTSELMVVNNDGTSTGQNNDGFVTIAGSGDDRWFVVTVETFGGCDASYRLLLAGDPIEFETAAEQD